MSTQTEEKAGEPLLESPAAVEMAAAPAITRRASSAGRQLMTDQEANTTALLNAAYKNDVSMLLKLIRSGINPSSSDYDKRCALHIAASEGGIECVRLLIEEGAEVNAKDRFDFSPLDEAVKNGFDAIAQILRDNGASFGAEDRQEEQLIKAAAAGDTIEADRLLKNGINPNCGDYDKRRPLHLAVAEGHVDVAKLLLASNADPTAADRFGITPLDEVSRHAIRTGDDPMKNLFSAYFHKDEETAWSKFVLVFGFMELVVLVLMCLVCTYNPMAQGTNTEANNPIRTLYGWFQDIHVMIFIGFGFLMTFLRKNLFSSVGLTFLIGGFVIQWHILAAGFIEQLFAGHGFHSIAIDLKSLVLGDFAAGAVLITYGVLLGKVSPLQMMAIAILEPIFFAINESIGIKMVIADLGGSIVVHMFGAFFGMALSITMYNKHLSTSADNASVYHSDLFAMIGTIFLWMYWPSFNAALAGSDGQQHRAVVNTVLSLTGSCVMGFVASWSLRKEKRFNMVDVQNATLAGGVAMGSACDLDISPGIALLIGAAAGVLSVWGYVSVQPFLERKIKFSDTCGVNNLHGMPSILGALAGVVATAVIPKSNYGEGEGSQLQAIYENSMYIGRTESEQAIQHLLFTIITLVVSSITGALTGIIVKSSFFDPLPEKRGFSDDVSWEVPDLELPYFFDHRGELNRDAGSNAAVARDVNVKSISDKLNARISVLETKIDINSKNSSTNANNQPNIVIMPPTYGQPTQALPSRLEGLLESLVTKLGASEAQKQA